MGLKLTLEKEKNYLYHTFENAYWAIKEIDRTNARVHFNESVTPVVVVQNISGLIYLCNLNTVEFFYRPPS